MKLVNVVEFQRAQRASLDTDGALALRHALRAAVAFGTLARLRVDGRRMVWACDGAITAADAFVSVDTYQTKLVFMHGTRWAHVHAFRVRTVVARKRYVVAIRRGFHGSVSGKLTRTAFVVDNAAIFATCDKIIEIDARHFASATTRAT